MGSKGWLSHTIAASNTNYRKGSGKKHFSVKRLRATRTGQAFSASATPPAFDSKAAVNATVHYDDAKGPHHENISIDWRKGLVFAVDPVSRVSHRRLVGYLSDIPSNHITCHDQHLSPALSEMEEIGPSGESRSTGQGFGLSAEQRKAVEVRSMRVAMDYYSKHWPTVKDVSLRESFDVHCVNGFEEQRVEVKGTTGDGTSVLLTKNEVELAREFSPKTALFVVSDICLRKEGGNWVAEGGQAMEITPWTAPAESLEAIAYEYRLQGSALLME